MPARSRAGEFLAYMTVSAIALVVDLAVLYLLAVLLALDKPASALVAYCAGFIVHYALAGVAGATASYVIVLAGTMLGASLWSSKAVAVVISFAIAYSLRRYFLFTRI